MCASPLPPPPEQAISATIPATTRRPISAGDAVDREQPPSVRLVPGWTRVPAGPGGVAPSLPPCDWPRCGPYPATGAALRPLPFDRRAGRRRPPRPRRGTAASSSLRRFGRVRHSRIEFASTSRARRSSSASIPESLNGCRGSRGWPTTRAGWSISRRCSRARRGLAQQQALEHGDGGAGPPAGPVEADVEQEVGAGDRARRGAS